MRSIRCYEAPSPNGFAVPHMTPHTIIMLIDGSKRRLGALHLPQPRRIPAVMRHSGIRKTAGAWFPGMRPRILHRHQHACQGQSTASWHHYTLSRTRIVPATKRRAEPQYGGPFIQEDVMAVAEAWLPADISILAMLRQESGV